jgi:outer membrane receptor protein involved in Fe transport
MARSRGSGAQDALLFLVDGAYETTFAEIDAAGYVQEDWKATPSLTLHLGLRWEYFSQALQQAAR